MSIASGDSKLGFEFDGASCRQQVPSRSENRQWVVRRDLSRSVVYSVLFVFCFLVYCELMLLIVNFCFAGTNVQTNEEVAIKLVSVLASELVNFY